MSKRTKEDASEADRIVRRITDGVTTEEWQKIGSVSPDDQVRIAVEGLERALGRSVTAQDLLNGAEHYQKLSKAFLDRAEEMLPKKSKVSN